VETGPERRQGRLAGPAPSGRVGVVGIGWAADATSRPPAPRGVTNSRPTGQRLDVPVEDCREFGHDRDVAPGRIGQPHAEVGSDRRQLADGGAVAGEYRRSIELLLLPGNEDRLITKIRASFPAITLVALHFLPTSTPPTTDRPQDCEAHAFVWNRELFPFFSLPPSTDPTGASSHPTTVHLSSGCAAGEDASVSFRPAGSTPGGTETTDPTPHASWKLSANHQEADDQPVAPGQAHRSATHRRPQGAPLLDRPGRSRRGQSR
jgi:hypothetical protein